LRKRAHQYRQAAQASDNPERRLTQLRMAAHFDQLAAQREARNAPAGEQDAADC
jgi:hypothetical protein